MQTQSVKPNWAGGMFAFLIVLFIFGFFVGLPVIGWAVLLAAFVGLWVTTSKQRAHERQESDPVLTGDRPWRK